MPRTPETVSALWQAFYAAAPDPAQTPMTPAPDDLAGWARAQQVIDAPQLPVVEAALRGFAGRVFDAEIGGVPVIEVHPANAKPARGAIVYVHGGAYTLFSASARLMSVLPIVERTGMQVIAVDYTLAPQARWPVALDQIVSVFDGIYKNKRGPVALYGDSAGGGLAAAATLRMRERGVKLPEALALWSPWSDIGEVGDSYATLAEADASYRYDRHLANAALAYADHDQHRNPLVSPVYGDFTAGFPPTLIQGGTREIFLSNFVRLYRALVDAKQPAILDLYEGMPHVFQAYPAQAGSPESRAALDATAAFLADHLKRAATKRRT
ncbi:alpha/beta hydrolase [Sphingopyxis sp.]|uniref:alpha/beta hydrolase fold domain-containing protein n=1 Tax=Sphingopyxis sp. TaxID=1908224 RepID=UPI0010F8991D|nr:alpha/beta hydrolase [Sphingopyxis sp.]MBR2173523.1 alpha/beta hydrolase [Sphingopyxis sp.]